MEQGWYKRRHTAFRNISSLSSYSNQPIMQSVTVILVFVGCAMACAVMTPEERKKRAAGDVVIVFRTKEVYKAGENAVHLRDVKQKLAAFARANGVDNSLLKPTVQNVLGRFAARIEIIGGIGYCQDVKRFVKGALYELPQVTDAKVKCGDALGQTISRN